METTTTQLRLVPGAQVEAATNFVPKGATLKGNMEADVDLAVRIEGEFTGRIDMKVNGLVHIAASATIDTELLVADFIVIEGNVTGTIHARKGLELCKTARVKGSIRYDADLDFHQGARINGDINGPAD
jgi:cytoskeletal protein CcmA (bactofilin family)